MRCARKPNASDATRKIPIAASPATRSLRLMYPIASAVPMQKTTIAAYGIHSIAAKAGDANMINHAAPAPPNPLWLIPSPMNAHRRATTKTESTAQAIAIAEVAMRGERLIVLARQNTLVIPRNSRTIAVTYHAD